MATSDEEQATGEGASSPEGGEEERCPICWSRLCKRSCTMLGCKHSFHLDCIGAEFNIVRCMQCPICRQIDLGGTWRYWGNELPANIAMSRRPANSSPALQFGSFPSSRESADPSLEGALSLRALDPDLYRAYVEIINPTSAREWRRAERPVLFYSGRTNSRDSVFDAPYGPQLDATDSQWRERGTHSLDFPRPFSLSESIAQSGPNHSTIQRQPSRYYNERHAPSAQEQSQHAANLNAFTGPASNQRVRPETTREAEAQQEAWNLQMLQELQAVAQLNVAADSWEYASRANDGTHNLERAGYEVQARTTTAQQDFGEDNPALGPRVRHAAEEEHFSLSGPNEE